MSSTAPPTNPARRQFIAGASTLVVGASLPIAPRLQAATGPASDSGTFAPNAFVRVNEDSTVTVIVKHIEFGQGPWTGLATMVAEELDADWSQIRAEHAPANAALYANAAFGVQGTGGSTAIASSYLPMRQAGAAARAMLVSAAARAWDVPAGEITVSSGIINHAASGKQGTFGEFARLAATEEVPAEPALKSPDQFTLIGRDTRKLDTQAKTTGAADFTLDVYRPGMLTVVVAHPSRLGAKVASVDDSAARAVPGVVDVRRISAGVAVYGRDTYSALQGRKALEITWDDTASEKRSTEQLEQAWLATVRKGPGTVAGSHGDIDAGFGAGTETFEAEYVFPYLVHAPMEPLDGVMELGEDGHLDVWMGSQLQTVDQGTIAAVAGVEPTKVRVHTMLAGGSFGRRAQPTSHFAAELTEAWKAHGGETPIKLMYTREDDIQGGWYRPLTVHRLRGALDDDGNIVAWDQTIASQSILQGSPFEGMIVNGVDTTMVEGARELPYALSNMRVTAHMTESPVTTLWWRSVGHTHTGYAVETFLDELLEAGGQDPVAGRLALMGDKSPRLAATLERAAKMAQWGREAEPGHAFGVACVESFGSFVTQIVDVSLGDDGMPHVHKVWCAVDCGVAINPNVVTAQMEGGIGYGLGAILHNALELAPGGTVRQSNFHDYPSLRLSEMPEVAVAVIASREAPTGVGEPGVPPIGPAVANAVRKLTGGTPRLLPMRRSLSA
ncbi:MAG: xanthine dehydrogenase family protein molybdopterin-binding subunit [Pseudomonadota bacterium]